MRPLQTILDQIRWDARFDAGRFRVRWLERAASSSTASKEREREEPLRSFLARRDLPHHRVRALLCDGRVVWSRDDGVDEFAAVVEGVTASVDVSGVAFWNVLDDDDNARREDAVVAAVTALAREHAVVGLVEVTAPLLARLRADLKGKDVIDEGSVAVIVAAGHVWRREALPLPGRNGLLVSCGDLAIAVAHLTSSVRGDRSERRREQREALARALPAHGRLVVVVDANSEDALSELDACGLVDAGAAAGPTFAGDGSRPPRRIDRISLRGLDATDVSVDRSVSASDHWPLKARCAATTTTTRPLPVRHEVKRALCLVPPDDVCAALDVVRRDHDKGAARWPPHINLAFPFVDAAARDDVVVALAHAFAQVAPFRVQLGPTAIFGARHRAATVVDDGSCARLMELVDTVTQPAPREDGLSRTPHLTLATDGFVVDDEGIAAVSFDVDHVCVVARDDDGPFGVEVRVALGGASLDDALAATGLLEGEVGVSAALQASLNRLPGRCTVVGSTALGVRFVDSDVDVAWAPPLDVGDPLALAQQLLGGTRTDAVAAPRIKTVIDGVSVDLVVGGADSIAVAQTPLSPSQRQALRALRLWARRRDLRPRDNNAMPSSVAWLGLVVEGSNEGAAGDVVVDIWRRIADEDDLAAVSGTGFRGVSPKALARLRDEARRALSFVSDDGRAAWSTVLLP